MPEDHHPPTPSKATSDTESRAVPGRPRRNSPRRGRQQPRLVAQPAQPQDPAEAPRLANPMDEDFDYREAFKTLDFAEVERESSGPDRFAGLVARRLRSLRPALRPDGLARRGHLPRRDGRGGGGRWDAALRAAEQLARQRQPGQGPPPAVAGQEEVRQQDLVGRPHRLRGQPALEHMGFATVGFACGRADSGSPRRTSTGVRRAPGSATSATPATATWRTRWPPSRWV